MDSQRLLSIHSDVYGATFVNSWNASTQKITPLSHCKLHWVTHWCDPDCTNTPQVLESWTNYTPHVRVHCIL